MVWDVEDGAGVQWTPLPKAEAPTEPTGENVPYLFYGADLALLLTDAAAYALSMVDNSLAVTHRDSRTSELHTHLAAYALVCIHLERRIMLDVLQQCARTA